MSDAQIDFLVICPLAEERDAVLNLLPGHRRIDPVLDDTNTYFQAELGIAECERKYRLVVLPLTGMGLVNAASATANAIQRWKARYVLVTGIAGGVAKNGVDLGDVLISDQIADYELQKIEGGKGSIRWQVHRADMRLLSAAMNHMDQDWRSVESKRFNSNNPRVHFGPICTGNKVIDDESLINQYIDVWRKMIGVEMEGGGVANAVWQSATQPGMLMIRGVSDLADGRKDSASTKRWRQYACDIAASWTINFLKSGPVPITGAKESAESYNSSMTNNTNEPVTAEQMAAFPNGLLERLSSLPSSMFEEIVFRLETEHVMRQGKVPGSEAPQSTRSVRLLALVRAQQLLPKLLEILIEMRVWKNEDNNTPIEGKSPKVIVGPKPNFPDRKTKVLIVGSYSTKQPKSEQRAFERACQELGQELVRAGYTIVGSSSKPTTADYHVFAGANKSGIRGKVILIRPTASVESDDFEKSVLSNLEVERQYVRGMHSDARQSQIDEANLIIAVGGATGTKEVMDLAEKSRKAVIPIGAFGGTVLENWDVQADRLFDENDLAKRFGVLRVRFDTSLITQLLEELADLPMPMRHFEAKSLTENPTEDKTLQALSTNRFKIALSFPGEEREFVEELANYLATKLSKREVFYDEWFEVELLGAGGDLKLVAMYEQADLVVPFFSKHYDKPWCQLEWETIRGILLTRRKSDAVIPVHMDDTAIPGWAVVNFGIRRKSRSPQVIGQILLDALDLRARRSQSDIKQSTPISNADLSSAPPQRELAEELIDYLNTQRDLAADKSSRTEIDRHLAELNAYIPKILKLPTELEQRRFLRQSFATICDFFTQAGNLLEKSNSRVNIEFSQPDTEKFRCEIYLDGKQITSCRIWIGSGKFDFGINYSQGRDVSGEFTARNETIVVDTSGGGESLKLRGILGISQSETIEQADAQTASQVLWKRFVKQLES